MDKIFQYQWVLRSKRDFDYERITGKDSKQITTHVNVWQTSYKNFLLSFPISLMDIYEYEGIKRTGVKRRSVSLFYSIEFYVLKRRIRTWIKKN